LIIESWGVGELKVFLVENQEAADKCGDASEMQPDGAAMLKSQENDTHHR
jgi:transcription elongation GreA/GreB family factor